MKKILQIDGKSKVRKARAVEVMGLKFKGYRHLIELRNALQREIQNRGGMDERKETMAA